MSERTKSGVVIGLLVTVASAAGTVGMQDAWSDTPHRAFLEGDYSYWVAGYCVESEASPAGTAGFNPTTLQLLVPGQTFNLTGGGTLHFSRDGTMTLSGSANWLLPAQISGGDFPVLAGLQMNSVSAASYKLGKDDTISIPGAAFQLTVNSSTSAIVQPVAFEGFAIGSTVNLNEKPSVVTLQMFVNGVEAQQTQVICLQTLNAVKHDS